MKVKVDINDEHDETCITIQAKEWSEELEYIVKMIKSRNTKRLVGVEQDQSILIHPNEIDYVFAENRKVFAAMAQQKVELKMKLYEVESLLKPLHFTRFSKSVIGNLNQILRFELAFNGSLCVHFKSGNKEYVTRNYVAEIKEKLILGGGSYGN
ncbi:LytTR family DNA-binding domain-containing protein [Bacillus sp. FJAT-52991]|uniref:LytTR family DNA-binding domain-containing protein n=1 Tax=Bacillus kandeliae TaxID=3129297 RepID=A0ABZ2N8Y7_9BACI